MHDEHPAAPSSASDSELEWFTGAHADLSRIVRRLWEVHDQLDGGLTAGQATGEHVFVAFCLKYELRAGLVRELTEFERTRLSGSDLATERLTSVAGRLSATREHLYTRADRTAHARYGDIALVKETQQAVRVAAAELQALLDDCVSALVDRSVGGRS